MASEPAGLLKFRPPKSADFEPPSVKSLQGKWHVTHSTLPMWKSNRNVTISYKSMEHNADVLDDLVEYQPLNSNKQKVVRGVSTPDANIVGAYNWRGNGWLMIASSHWEILGYGEEEGGWALTFFEKTLFTPAGLDIYARNKEGLSPVLVEQIKAALKAMKDDRIDLLTEQIFEVKQD